MAAKNGHPDEALGNLYPFQDRTVTLRDGTCMHYVEQGRAFRRPTFLLIHGNPTWSFLYRDVIAPLSKFGRVIAVDLVGFGRSDHPSDPDYHSLDQHIANLEEFVERLGLKRVVPVVQDWGGPIGLGWATRHPDLVAGVIIQNSWAFNEPGPKMPWMFRALRAKGLGEFAFERQNAFVERILPRLFIREVTVAEMDGYRYPFPTRSSRTATMMFPRMVSNSNDTMAAIEAALPNLDVPALILWGEKDPVFPLALAKRFQDLLPQAGAPIVIDDAGHCLPEDAPDEFMTHVAPFAKSL